MDGILMGFLARELHGLLAGARVDRISQPDDDLVVLALRHQGQNHRLLLCATPGMARLHLSQQSYENPAQAPTFLMLLRKHLQGGRLLAIEQLHGDRLIRLSFSAQTELGDPTAAYLYLEAMGKHSNLSLVRDGYILDSLRHVTFNMSRVRQMLPGLPFVMPPAQDKLNPDSISLEAIKARLGGTSGPLSRFLETHLAGTSRASAQELALRLLGGEEGEPGGVESQSPDRLAGDILALVQGLAGRYAPQLLFDPEGLPKAVLPFPFISFPAQLQQPQPSLSQALETLYHLRDSHLRLSQRSSGLKKAMQQAMERLQKKLVLLEEDILSPKQAEELRIAGELITANIHLIPKGAEQVMLPDYYLGGERLISLDHTLSPAQNAQRYFKKYRKAHTARKLAGEQREQALLTLRRLEEAAFFLEGARSPSEISEIRADLAGDGLLRREKGSTHQKKPTKSQPLRYQSPEGLLIQVGKNAAQNEALLKAARGEDLWLHALDIPGAHVLVSDPGQHIPEASLRMAAKLAVYHSAARGQSHRVDYTRRKLVRKIAGAGPGQVHYSGQKSLLVSATEEEIAGLSPSPGYHPNKQAGRKKTS